jgi:hypothetical protein
LNVITPDFVGQVYVQADGTIWQAGTLLANSWTVICDSNGVGLIWGPLPDTITDLIGSGDTLTTAISGILQITAYTDFSFGQPTTVTNNVSVNASAYTSLEMRLLTTIGAGFTARDDTLLTSLSLPVLATVGNDFSVRNTGLISLSLPSLVTIGAGIFFRDCPNLTSVSLPALTTIVNDVSGFTSPSLTSFSAPLWVPTDTTSINFNGDALDVLSVELILRRCVLAGVIACAIDLSGGTNAGTASLSAQGQADVATLGAQVTMNP